MSYLVPTHSDDRHRALMRFLDKVEGIMRSRELNQAEYQELINFKLKVNAMRFGNKPELEYPHWAEIYNRTQYMLDQPRRVPIAGGAPSERRDHQDEENAVHQLYEEEFDQSPLPDHPADEHEEESGDNMRDE